MKKVVLTLVALLIAAVLAGCSPISSGTITGKKHSDSYWYPTTVCYGQPLRCTQQMNYMPEYWQFDLAQDDETGFVSVDGDTYDRYEVGDLYNPNH